MVVQSLEILKKSFNLQRNFPDLENRGRGTQSGKIRIEIVYKEESAE